MIDNFSDDVGVSARAQAPAMTCEMLFGAQDVAVCAVTGEVDLSTVTRLTDLLHAAECDRGHHLILDLSGVTFFCAAGVEMLCTVRHRRHPGSRLVLVTSRVVERVLAICEVGISPFERSPSSTDAVAACARSAAPSPPGPQRGPDYAVL